MVGDKYKPRDIIDFLSKDEVVTLIYRDKKNVKFKDKNGEIVPCLRRDFNFMFKRIPSESEEK